MIDLSGKKFGKLLVIEKSLERVRGLLSWSCLCDCGNSKVVAGPDIRSGDTKSCGCLVNARPSKDISGKRFGRLVAVNRTNEKSKNGDYLWNCLCDCGCYRTVSVGRLNHGKVISCKFCAKERLSKKVKTHGMSGSKEYVTWARIKDRCYNENNNSYGDYGGSGILMSENFVENFDAFYKEIGPCPVDGKRWSVDRINRSHGYIEGNMRWATDNDQARNKGMSSNNKTGKTGVTFETKTHPNKKSKTDYWVAQWKSIDGRSMKRCFSCKKYGYEFARFLADECRDIHIERLNLLGAGYAQNHGT